MRVNFPSKRLNHPLGGSLNTSQRSAPAGHFSRPMLRLPPCAAGITISSKPEPGELKITGYAPAIIIDGRDSQTGDLGIWVKLTGRNFRCSVECWCCSARACSPKRYCEDARGAIGATPTFFCVCAGGNAWWERVAAEARRLMELTGPIGACRRTYTQPAEAATLSAQRMARPGCLTSWRYARVHVRAPLALSWLSPLRQSSRPNPRAATGEAPTLCPCRRSRRPVLPAQNRRA